MVEMTENDVVPLPSLVWRCEFIPWRQIEEGGGATLLHVLLEIWCTQCSTVFFTPCNVFVNLLTIFYYVEQIKKVIWTRMYNMDSHV